MRHHEQYGKEHTKSTLGTWIFRLVLSIVVLGITSFLTPGFSIQGLTSLVIAAIIITVIDYLIEAVTGFDVSPIGRGIKGFIISAIILYLTQFFVPQMRVSMIGALLSALVIGIIDALIPSRMM